MTDSAPQKLNHVLRLVHTLRSSTSIEDLLPRVLEALFGTFSSGERIAIVLNETFGSDIYVAAAAARIQASEVEVCLPLVRTAMDQREAILYVDHLRGKNTGETADSSPEMRSILVAPLVSATHESIGAIQIDCSDRRYPLNNHDVEKLAVVTSVISYSAELVLAFASETRKAVNHQITADADRLRRHLSPRTFPDVSGMRVSHRMLTVTDVAADFVDYIMLPNGGVACLLVDVPGRGTSATDTMALVSRLALEAVLRCESPADALDRLEQQLAVRCDSIPMMTSVAILTIDPVQHSVCAAVSGHCPMILVDRSGNEKANITLASGPALGTQQQHVNYDVPLEPGDSLLTFTDGIISLACDAGQAIRRPDLLSFVGKASHSDAGPLDAELLRLLTEHCKDTVLTDDVAIHMIQRNPFAFSGSDTTDGI